MRILPNFPETQTRSTENVPRIPNGNVLSPHDALMPSLCGFSKFSVSPVFLPGSGKEFANGLTPLSVPAWLLPDLADARLPELGVSSVFQPETFLPETYLSELNGGDVWGGGLGLAVRDLPQFVITNSYDDDEDDEGMDDLSDGDDEDIYEEVESYADFDDDFDDDFEDEFDEDYEDLARVDDEDGDGEDDELGTTSTRYEEEFGDVDSQTKFLPDNEETIIDEIDVSGASVFNDFDDDEENGAFNEYDS